MHLRRERRRSFLSPGVAVLVLVIVLSVAGWAATTHVVRDDRRQAAQRRADDHALEVRNVLQRVRAFAVGLGNALQGERVTGSQRFAALVGSATTTVGLTTAMWVERVDEAARPAYEQRTGLRITALPGMRTTAGGTHYLPATFVTGGTVPPGTDLAGVPALAATLREPASLFAGTATTAGSLGGRHGFFVVQGARFGQGPDRRGLLVVFVPADWLGASLKTDPSRIAIGLSGWPLSGALASPSAARRQFEALTRTWTVDVAAEPRTALQATLPGLAAAWAPLTALLVFLVGRGMTRRRRAERQVDDIFDLSPDILCVVGFDGYLKRVNPAFERTLGYAAAELLARPLLDFVHADDRERNRERFRGLRAGLGAMEFEARLVDARGVPRWIQWNVRSVPAQGLLYAAARDVTVNRRLAHEVGASRRRIVTAADEARRRIERDLHDGAQQRLVTTVVFLKLTRKALAEGDASVTELVDEALANAESGIEEVRELARGIHPRILTSGGLGPALHHLGRRSPVPVTVDVQADARLPEPVEVTAYYVASEALTNVAKHARAAHVWITATVTDRRLVLSVRDDGVGGADRSRGSGLIGLADRVEALGGTLSVSGAPGGGTTISAKIPLA
ncbi:PAS domain-containing sensor histidine kinase [Solirubrobacter pauli]|uniref:PAS domain-containing sensor histidine kinase n=1 Tax=Solirubrobacter pauli TaxID=166793 RepID=UPI000EAF21A6|nr:PAS domain-containing sensor histidine kinase [Solirubrobacter pauli]